MKDLIFAELGRSVPLYAGLAAQVGVMPSIIFVQLEFLTGMKTDVNIDGEVKKVRKHINGFYKYLKRPSQNEKGEFPPQYRIGDSWCEWLGCTSDIFLTGFKKIGVAYPSVKAFNDACKSSGDPFEGKLYISVIDHKMNLTNYYRNHGVADKFLSDFCAGVPVTACLKRKGGEPASGESEESPEKKSPSEVNTSQSPPVSPSTGIDIGVTDCLEKKGEKPDSRESSLPSLISQTAVSEVANSPLPASSITSSITTDITKDIVIQREREREEEEEKEALSLFDQNIAEFNSSQVHDKPVLQPEPAKPNFSFPDAGGNGSVFEKRKEAARVLQAQAPRSGFMYTDDATGIYIQNQDDWDFRNAMVGEYGIDEIKEASAKMRAQGRKVWATKVAEELKPIGKKRGSNISLDKHSEFEKKDYRKGVNDDGTF